MSLKYAAARRGYPDALYKYLKNLAAKGKITTLDLGCGTGISTRELKKHGFKVMGADKDVKMIKTARNGGGKIKYLVAPADKLPFANNHFDIITAFTAFHWFNDKKSLLEISRVLKPGGLFFAALKSNHKSKRTNHVRQKYRKILKKYAGKNFDGTQKHFKTKLLKNIFVRAQIKSFRLDEKYTVPEALTLIQSLSFWNLVTAKNKPRMLEEVKELYNKNLVKGLVVRNREIFTIAAFKPQI